MNIYVLVYESFTQFEVVLANYFLKTKGSIITVGIDDKPVVSSEGFITLPHKTINDVSADVIDLFLIPGGDPKTLLKNQVFSSFLNNIVCRDIKIGAICSGVLHLARSGALKNKKYTTSLSLEEYDSFDLNNFQDQNVVIDGNIITAKANGYVDFALKLGTIMDIYENDADYQETVDYFKNFIG